MVAAEIKDSPVQKKGEEEGYKIGRSELESKRCVHYQGRSRPALERSFGFPFQRMKAGWIEAAVIYIETCRMTCS